MKATLTQSVTFKYVIQSLWLKVLLSRFSIDSELQQEFASFFKLQSFVLQRPCNFSLKPYAPPSAKKMSVSDSLSKCYIWKFTYI